MDANGTRFLSHRRHRLHGSRRAPGWRMQAI